MCTFKPISMKECEICGSEDFKVIGKEIIKNVKTKTSTMEFSVKLVCCKRCGLVFQDPLQDEEKLEKYYSHMYREEKIRPSNIIKNEFKNRVDFLLKFKDPKKHQSLLEVGCADGSTLSQFKNKGFSVFGIDPSLENTKICQSKGLEVQNSMYENLEIPNEKFDFICGYYMMEHLRSPVDFIKFCNNFLKDDGIIGIEIPNISAYKNEETTSDLLFFFEHQYHFTKDTITLLLQRCGFKLLEFSDKPTHSFGMYFAAQKISKPITPKEIKVSDGASKKVIDEINDYRNHYSTKLTNLKIKIKKIMKEAESKKEKVVFFPGGSYTKMLLELPELNKKFVKLIIDNNPEKWNTNIWGINIQSPNRINPDLDRVIITGSFTKELKDQVLKMGVSEKKIMIL